jgi:hypothetical protein
MNDDELRSIFKFGLTKLSVDDDGLTRDGNDPLDLKTMMVLCAAIRASVDSGDTLQQLHLQRVAALTEDLIAAWGFANPGIAREWLLARSELLQVEIPRA